MNRNKKLAEATGRMELSRYFAVKTAEAVIECCRCGDFGAAMEGVKQLSYWGRKARSAKARIAKVKEAS